MLPRREPLGTPHEDEQQPAQYASRSKPQRLGDQVWVGHCLELISPRLYRDDYSTGSMAASEGRQPGRSACRLSGWSPADGSLASRLRARSEAFAVHPESCPGEE